MAKASNRKGQVCEFCGDVMIHVTSELYYLTEFKIMSVPKLARNMAHKYCDLYCEPILIMPNNI